MKIYESAEDYLEAILMIGKRKGQVRSIDVVNELGVSKPSVSVAMKKLRESGHIAMDTDGYITLLPAGQEVADHVYVRHETITKLLTALGVSPDVAAADACKIEHHLSDETFQCICNYAATHLKNQ